MGMPSEAEMGGLKSDIAPTDLRRRFFNGRLDGVLLFVSLLYTTERGYSGWGASKAPRVASRKRDKPKKNLKKIF